MKRERKSGLLEEQRWKYLIKNLADVLNLHITAIINIEGQKKIMAFPEESPDVCYKHQRNPLVKEACLRFYNTELIKGEEVTALPGPFFKKCPLDIDMLIVPLINNNRLYLNLSQKGRKGILSQETKTLIKKKENENNERGAFCSEEKILKIGKIIQNLVRKNNSSKQSIFRETALENFSNNFRYFQHLLFEYGLFKKDKIIDLCLSHILFYINTGTCFLIAKENNSTRVYSTGEYAQKINEIWESMNWSTLSKLQEFSGCWEEILSAHDVNFTKNHNGIVIPLHSEDVFWGVLGILEPENESFFWDKLSEIRKDLIYTLKLNNVIKHLGEKTVSILENINDGIIVVDKLGVILFIDNYLREQFNLGSRSSLTVQELPEEIIIFFEERPDVKNNHSGIFQIQTTVKNKEKSFSWHSFPLCFGEEEYSGTMLILNDVSNLLDFQKQFGAAEQLSTVGQLSASLVHEIRNPLTAARGWLQLIKTCEDRSDINKYADWVNNELERIQKLIKNFLSLSKIKKLRLKEVNLGNLLRELINFLEAEARLHSVSFDLELPVEPVLVNIDADQMKQVFQTFAKMQ